MALRKWSFPAKGDSKHIMFGMFPVSEGHFNQPKWYLYGRVILLLTMSNKNAKFYLRMVEDKADSQSKWIES